MQNEDLKPTENKKHEWDSLAMEIAGKLKAAERAKNIAIVTLGVAIVIITIWLTALNYRNDREWRELFSEYDYISQDGEGFNNVNTGTQGNLDNSSEE